MKRKELVVLLVAALAAAGAVVAFIASRPKPVVVAVVELQGEASSDAIEVLEGELAKKARVRPRRRAHHLTRRHPR